MRLSRDKVNKVAHTVTDALAEIGRRAPAEVVAGVAAVSHVNVEFIAHRKTRTGEEKPMAIR